MHSNIHFWYDNRNDRLIWYNFPVSTWKYVENRGHTHRAWALLGTRDDALLKPYANKNATFKNISVWYCTYGSENICLKNFIFIQSYATKLTLMFYVFLRTERRYSALHTAEVEWVNNFNASHLQYYTECVWIKAFFGICDTSST